MAAIDLERPLYIFVMVGPSEHPRTESEIHGILHEYVTSVSSGKERSLHDDVTTSQETGEIGARAPAIRGSTPPFGTWSSPKVAIKISESKCQESLAAVHDCVVTWDAAVHNYVRSRILILGSIIRDTPTVMGSLSVMWR